MCNISSATIAANKICVNGISFSSRDLEELQQYRQIGTAEECRAAKEKQQPKKPTAGADFMVGRDDDGNPIWETDYVCSECGMGVAGEYICCPYCGQAIKWESEE